MINLKLFCSGVIDFCRAFSTKTDGKISKTLQSSYSKRKQYKKMSEPEIKWTDEQNAVLNHVRNGLSVFYTGSAGTGKTLLLKHIVDILRKIHGKTGRSSKVVVTASTGIAACAIQGRTLHSFAGLGLADKDRKSLLERVERNRRVRNRWIKANVLVIDEISMIDANMFDNLEYIVRKVRNPDKVWGGLQLIVSGDFFQLTPIIDKNDNSGKELAFEADCWNDSFNEQIEITKVFRQEDPKLIRLLQDIRKGAINDEDLKLLEQRCCDNEPDASVMRLYPRNEDVNRVNEVRLKSLGEKIVSFKAEDGGPDVDHWKTALSQGIAKDQLDLCKGARVILLKNLNVWQKLCNGATGTVTGFVERNEDVKSLSPDHLLPVVKFDSGKEMVIEPQKWEFFEGSDVVAWRLQVPLRLAYAFSIHKCQGMTIDCVHTNLSRTFGYGMVYVALSRLRTLEGLSLSGFRPSMIKAHQKVVSFYEQLAQKQSREDENGEEITIEEDVTNEEEVSNSKVTGRSEKTGIQGVNRDLSPLQFLLSRYQKVRSS